jgi:hypothetical protein
MSNPTKKSRFHIERLEDRIAPSVYAWGCDSNGGSNHGGSDKSCGGSNHGGSDKSCNGGSNHGGSNKACNGGSKHGGSDKSCNGGSKHGGSNKAPKDNCVPKNDPCVVKTKCK